MFGSDILVAPMLEDAKERLVYLPQGQNWVDYQSGKVYKPGWRTIEAGEIEIVMLVKQGAKIKHVPVAQSVDKIQWDKVTVKKY